jgi:DNA-binding MarR family transcriptional regulator
MSAATDEQLRALVGYNIKRANSGIFAGVEGTLAPFGLRRTTYSALSVIVENRQIRQSELAEVLAIEKPNLVQILDELQGAGLIARARDAADRRVYLLSATAKGEARVAEASASLRAYDDRLTAGLSPEERAALIAALRRIEDNGPEAWEGRNVAEIPTP